LSHNSYELLFITDPALAPENLTALQDRIGSILTASKGEVEGIDDWGVRRLAYQINSLDEGRYVLVNFKCEPATLAELKKQLGYMQDVVRFMLIRKGD
jgi:small subunit ribosomal protein S6